MLESALNELSGKTSIFFVEHLRWLLLLTVKLYYKLLLYKEHFYKQHQAEIGKIQAKAKQSARAELLLVENYLFSLSTLSPKNSIDAAIGGTL